MSFRDNVFSAPQVFLLKFQRQKRGKNINSTTRLATQKYKPYYKAMLSIFIYIYNYLTVFNLLETKKLNSNTQQTIH